VRARSTGDPVVPPGGGILDLWPEPAKLPGWLTERDLDVYPADFARTGFTGGLNWSTRTPRPSTAASPPMRS
jgi:hypothetical protein